MIFLILDPEIFCWDIKRFIFYFCEGERAGEPGTAETAANRRKARAAAVVEMEHACYN